MNGGVHTLEDLLARCELNSETGCMLWTGALTKKGYGTLWFEGRPRVTHRVAYLLHFGEIISKGQQVLHTCHVFYPKGDKTNRRCCLGEHLYLGTNEDNIADREAAGRNINKIGEAHGMCKLTDLEVIAIHDSTENQRVCAARHSVTQAMVSLIRREMTRKYLWR